MTRKFIISTDSCVDLLKTYLYNNDVYCILLKRMTNGVETAELYDSFKEYEDFYASLRSGALPTTSLLSQFELSEYFQSVLAEESEGDIIHVSLSSGLSGTYENAVKAAAALNADLNGRKIYIFDSLIASLGMGMLVDRLIELRNRGMSAPDALRIAEDIRDHQQVFVIQNNLFHLKRGGRISGFKAAVGTLLNVKPILVFNEKGKLAIESNIKGKGKAVTHVLQKMHEYGAEILTDDKPAYIMHSSSGEFFTEFEEAVKKEFPSIKIKKGMIGPIVGTHVGEGSVAVLFEGTARLKI